MKGLRLSILKDALIGDCSNGGISSRCKQVTLVGPDVPAIFEASDDAPAVRLVKRTLGGEIVLHVEPVAPEVAFVSHVEPVGLHFMASGAFVATSDARFGEVLREHGHSSYCAIKLHDRREA